jgi:hypothetical protein
MSPGDTSQTAAHAEMSAEVSADAHGIGNGSVAAALRGRSGNLDAWVYDRDADTRIRSV